jgi:hypothetical protein
MSLASRLYQARTSAATATVEPHRPHRNTLALFGGSPRLASSSHTKELNKVRSPALNCVSRIDARPSTKSSDCQSGGSRKRKAINASRASNSVTAAPVSAPSAAGNADFSSATTGSMAISLRKNDAPS